jgi:hypothetical protein
MGSVVTAPEQETDVIRPTIVTGAGRAKFMLGLLTDGTTTLVATSGKNMNNAAFVRVAKLKGYTICPPRGPAVGTNTSLGGRTISNNDYENCQGADANRPGECAAPRLIQRAFEIPALMRNRAQWAMSEIFYQPNSEKRLEQDLYWVHGLTAHSCATCENLVPVLMCPHP